jgi:hypothetical protein
MADDNPPPNRDVALLYAPTEDGAGARIVRARNGSIETGEIRPAKEGQPIAPQTELVRLRPRPEVPQVCDVEVLHREQPIESKDALSGPAQVATARYRDNWDRIFGSQPAGRDSTLN